MSRCGHPGCGPASLVPPCGSTPAARGLSRSPVAGRSRADTDPWRDGTVRRPGPPCCRGRRTPLRLDPHGSAEPGAGRLRHLIRADAAGRPRQRIVVVDGNRRRVAARQGLNIADVPGRLPSDLLIALSVRSRHHHNVRLRCFSCQTQVGERGGHSRPVAHAEQLENNLADLVARQAEASPGRWRSFSRCRCAAP